MSIRIDNITRGRFGNKILQYNSLMQLAKKYNIEPSCNWDGESSYFKQIVNQIPSSKPIKLLFCKDIIDNKQLDFDRYEYILDDPAYCLHNVFYHITKTDPREFLELKDEFKPKLDKNILHIGIHIRGGDILGSNMGREIHPFDYYKKCIDDIINNTNNMFKKPKIFYVCSDDITFDTYKKTVHYLQSNNYNYKIGISTGTNKEHIYDFALLSECDILINSSSTYCICAGFLGKTNKLIYHYNSWIQRNLNYEKWNNKETSIINGISIIEFRKTFDNFWIDLFKSDNKFYNAYKFIIT